jgi:hypothetical protein
MTKRPHGQGSRNPWQAGAHAGDAAQCQGDADEPAASLPGPARHHPVAAPGRSAGRRGPGDRGRPRRHDRGDAGHLPALPDGRDRLQHRAGDSGRAGAGRVRPPRERPAGRRRPAPVPGRAVRPRAVRRHAAPRDRVGPGAGRGHPGAPPRRPPGRLRHARHGADPPHAHRRAPRDHAAPRRPAARRPRPPRPDRPAHGHRPRRHRDALRRPQGRLNPRPPPRRGRGLRRTGYGPARNATAAESTGAMWR